MQNKFRRRHLRKWEQDRLWLGKKGWTDLRWPRCWCPGCGASAIYRFCAHHLNFLNTDYAEALQTWPRERAVATLLKVMERRHQ